MKKFRGFTLAEVLITLAIIGIVAAITLPSLLVNVNEKAWDAQRKALHARLAQAIGQMNTLGGYGTYTEDEDGTTTEDTAAESFILDALSKVYKINNVCGPDKLSSCGVPNKITSLSGAVELNFPTKMSELNSRLFNGYHAENEEGNIKDTKAAAFETVNGESIGVFYNPFCSGESASDYYTQNKMCVNFIYDLNGNQGPNQVGKDIGFITVFYKKSPTVVAAMPYAKDAAGGITMPQYSKDSNLNDAINSCKLENEDTRLPNKDELASLFVNAKLIDLGDSKNHYWSGTVISQKVNFGTAWCADIASGAVYQSYRTNPNCVRCIYK